MSLYRLARERAAADRPIQVGLIGAGKFGSMFLNQIPTMPGVEIAVIADLDPDRAKNACRTVGWDEPRIARTKFVARADLLGNSLVGSKMCFHGPALVWHALVSTVFLSARARQHLNSKVTTVETTGFVAGSRLARGKWLS